MVLLNRTTQLQDEFASMASKFDKLVATEGTKFIDVPTDHWALKFINSATLKGWINGYPDNTFAPERFISRAEVIKITNKMLFRSPDTTFIIANKNNLRNFTDLSESHWAYYEIVEATDGHDYNRVGENIMETWTRLNHLEFHVEEPK